MPGGIISGNTIIGNVGGNLTVVSMQDTSYYNSSQESASITASGGWNINTWSGRGGVAVNLAYQHIENKYQSVGDEQAGIKAGDGGFTLTVGGQTTLVGAVISSSEAAVANGLNYFSTNGLHLQDLLNAQSDTESAVSVTIGYDTTQNGIGGSHLIAGIPFILGGSGSETSTTYAGISGGIILNNGELATTDSDGNAINTAVRTGDPSGKLDNNFNLTEINAELAIGAALSKESGIFLNNMAANYPDSWGAGSTNRLLFTALVGGLTGNLSGSGIDVVQGAALSVIQGFGAQEIKDILSALPPGAATEGIRAALQGMLGCVGGAASGNCASGALGASASVVLGNLIELATGQVASNMTQPQKDQLTNTIASLVAGTATLLGGNAAVASLAAQIEADNNLEASVNVKAGAAAGGGGALGLGANFASNTTNSVWYKPNTWLNDVSASLTANFEWGLYEGVGIFGDVSASGTNANFVSQVNGYGTQKETSLYVVPVAVSTITGADYNGFGVSYTPTIGYIGGGITQSYTVPLIQYENSIVTINPALVPFSPTIWMRYTGIRYDSPQ